MVIKGDRDWSAEEDTRALELLGVDPHTHQVLIELRLLGQVSHGEVTLPEWMVQNLLPAESLNRVFSEEPLNEIIEGRREALHLRHLLINYLTN